MAIDNVVVKGRRSNANDGFDVRLSFDGDDDYTTGGTLEFTALVTAAIKAANAALGDANVRGFENLTVLDVIPGDCGQYVPSFDIDADSLVVRDGGHATWDEVGATTDLSTTTFNVTVVCK